MNTFTLLDQCNFIFQFKKTRYSRPSPNGPSDGRRPYSLTDARYSSNTDHTLLLRCLFQFCAFSSPYCGATFSLLQVMAFDAQLSSYVIHHDILPLCSPPVRAGHPKASHGF